MDFGASFECQRVSAFSKDKDGEILALGAGGTRRATRSVVS